MGCEDWVIFVSRSSVNSTNVPEISGVAYSALRDEMRLAEVACVRNLFFRASEKQYLMDPMMVKFAMVYVM